MSDIPKHLQQDVEFVAQVIQAKRMGPADNCQEPLEIDLTRSGVVAGYDFVVARLGDRLGIDGKAALWDDTNIRREMHHRYYVPEKLGAQIMYSAVRDMQEIQSL